MRLTRITLFFVVLILGLGFFRLGDYLLQDTETQTLQATEEMMVDSANLLAALIETQNEDPTVLESAFTSAKARTCEALIFKHLKTKMGLNAYLTDQTGKIIFDSQHPEWIGQDYAIKRDVALTLQGKYGARSSRLDPDDPMSSVMYVGAAVKKDGEIVACLSVYKAQADVHAFVEKRRRDIISAAIYFGVGILILIGAVFLWLFRPIGQLTEFARGISRGERKPKPEVGIGREVNTLANALHDMREALEGRQYAEQYIQTLTHELKSPLAAIRGAAELIDNDMPPADRDHFLNNIRTQTERCEHLIQRLLELSAIESQTHLENLPEINLTETCHRAFDTITPLAESSRIQLTQDLLPEALLRGNERLLRSAIIHLLENAIQFSPKNGKVTLSLTNDEENLVISVVDEGPGIPEFAAERAFDRFYSYRDEAPKEQHSKGNGLGLSFVREVASLHNGSATIEALPEKGTRARIVLPR